MNVAGVNDTRKHRRPKRQILSVNRNAIPPNLSKRRANPPTAPATAGMKPG